MLTFQSKQSAKTKATGPLSIAKNAKSVGSYDLYANPSKVGEAVANRVLDNVKEQMKK